MKITLMNLKYMYGGIYAIVVETDDCMYNDEECEFIIFDTKEEYEECIKVWNEEQIYTGRTWRTLFKKE